MATLKPGFGIRIGSDADPDAAFNFRVRIQRAKPMRIHAATDPDPGLTLRSLKVEFLHENYTLCRYGNS